MRTKERRDGRTDKAKLIFTFSYFAKAPKNWKTNLARTSRGLLLRLNQGFIVVVVVVDVVVVVVVVVQKISKYLIMCVTKIVTIISV